MSNIAYENSIVLQIDAANRAILNNGKNTPIILGVKGDNCAERVYFESPRYLSDEIDLFDAKDGGSVKVYIDFKNANNEPYIHECTRTVISDEETNKVTFYWLVSHYATVAKGDAKFNVCVKKFDGEDLVAEWHTTMFVGKILDSVEVTKRTPEVITPDAITLQALMNQVSDYEAAFDTFNEEIVNAESLVTTLVDQKMVNYALKPTVETLFERSANDTTCRLWAGETVDSWTLYGVTLSKVPTAGSKLRIYFNTTADDYYKYKSFVMELNVMENTTHSAVCGQASQYIIMSWGLTEYVFEGIMHVNFNPGDQCSDTSQNTLYFTLVTKKYDAQTIDDVYDSTLVCFYIDKVEMITGPGV